MHLLITKFTGNRMYRKLNNRLQGRDVGCKSIDRAEQHAEDDIVRV